MHSSTATRLALRHSSSARRGAGRRMAHSTIARCDYTVMIPMQHGVDSLNVAAAGAVAFWELRKR